ncbi:unnamed protein product, partial [Rotaria sp. Silwood2]
VFYFETDSSIDENAPLPIARAATILQTTFLPTNNFQSHIPLVQQSDQYGNNTFYNNQLQQYRPSSRSSSNYNHQRTRQHRPIQCYNCGKLGHKATYCFKPKQHLN